MSDLHCPANLVLARHGAYAGAPTWTSRPPGPGLTDEGRGQALSLAESLADRAVRHVWTSDLRRAEETGMVAADRLGVGRTTLPGLRELSVGRFEGETDPGRVGPVDAAFRAWLEGDLDARVPGGESGREVLERGSAALESIADQHRGETVLVVAHGGIICLTTALLCAGLAPAYVLAHGLRYCDAVEVSNDADGWVARSWAGDVLAARSTAAD
jgi:broad specificity phosphatase PhoE